MCETSACRHTPQKRVCQDVDLSQSDRDNSVFTMLTDCSINKCPCVLVSQS